MTNRRSLTLIALVLVGGLVGLAVGLAGSALLGAITGVICVAVALLAIRSVQADVRPH